MITTERSHPSDEFPWHAIDADAFDALERFTRDTSDLASAVAGARLRARLSFSGKYATITYARAIALAQRNSQHAAARTAWDEFFRAVDGFVTTLAFALENDGEPLSAQRRAQVRGLLQIFEDEASRLVVDGSALARTTSILLANPLVTSVGA